MLHKYQEALWGDIELRLRTAQANVNALVLHQAGIITYEEFKKMVHANHTDFPEYSKDAMEEWLYEIEDRALITGSNSLLVALIDLDNVLGFIDGEDSELITDELREKIDDKFADLLGYPIEASRRVRKYKHEPQPEVNIKISFK